MAQAPEPRFCPQCNAPAYFESFLCNLYVDGKDWVKPVHGDLKATILTVKKDAPRNLFKGHGRAVDRFCV
eukprot:1237281-Lingulodinium_polyedra.AAC.1